LYQPRKNRARRGADPKRLEFSRLYYQGGMFRCSPGPRRVKFVLGGGKRGTGAGEEREKTETGQGPGCRSTPRHLPSAARLSEQPVPNSRVSTGTPLLVGPIGRDRGPQPQPRHLPRSNRHNMTDANSLVARSRAAPVHTTPTFRPFRRALPGIAFSGARLGVCIKPRLGVPFQPRQLPQFAAATAGIKLSW